MNDLPEYEYYDSDPQTINSLLTKLPRLREKGLKVLDPCAGAGIFAERFEYLTGTKVDKFDIVKRVDDVQEQDFMKLKSFDKYDVIITNFPTTSRSATKGFDQLLKKALVDIRRGGTVCVLTKLKMLESQKRFVNIFMKYKPTYVYVYSNRLKCTKGTELVKTDTAFCWLIFEKDQDGFFAKETKLDWIHK